MISRAFQNNSEEFSHRKFRNSDTLPRHRRSHPMCALALLLSLLDEESKRTISKPIPIYMGGFRERRKIPIHTFTSSWRTRHTEKLRGHMVLEGYMWILFQKKEGYMVNVCGRESQPAARNLISLGCRAIRRNTLLKLDVAAKPFQFFLGNPPSCNLTASRNSICYCYS